MFTVKLYSQDGCRQIVEHADSFTILRCPVGDPGHDRGDAEITMHYKSGVSRRFDVRPASEQQEGWPPCFEKAIIENAAGKTTEIISLRPF